jgi:hypothetical protein
MPDEFSLLMQILAHGVPSVVITIATGENDDADLHSPDSSQF